MPRSVVCSVDDASSDLLQEPSGKGGVMRVISLVPSVTETLLAWGVEVVACTRFCEQPDLRHVGGTKDPDLEAIVALHPDLVVLDREENRLPDADALAARGVPLHITHVTALADVAPTLEALAAAVGAGAAAAASAAALAAIPPYDEWTTACTLIWRRPWMTVSADTFGSTMLERIGVGNVFAQHAERYPTVTLDDIAELAPSLVLLPTEPYSFKPAHVAELRAALPDCDVRELDGADLFWWGTRTPGAIRRLRTVLTS